MTCIHDMKSTGTKQISMVGPRDSFQCVKCKENFYKLKDGTWKPLNK